MKIEHTDREFDIVKFKDVYDKECSLQKSSAATFDAIWFGVTKPVIKVFQKGAWQDFVLPDEALIQTRMHLTQEQVKELLPYLIKFAESGNLTDALSDSQ